MTNKTKKQKLPVGKLHMTSHIWGEKKWLTKSCDSCRKGIGQTSTFGVILKTNEKLFYNWNKLLLICCLETKNLIKSDEVMFRPFSWLV